MNYYLRRDVFLLRYDSVIKCLLGYASRSAHVFIAAVCTAANQSLHEREMNKDIPTFLRSFTNSDIRRPTGGLRIFAKFRNRMSQVRRERTIDVGFKLQ